MYKRQGVSFPSFKNVAETFGYKYRLCQTNGEVEESIKWLNSIEERALLEIEQRFDDPVTPKLMSRLDENGKMQTPALQDMYPFIEKEELEQLMIGTKEEENN